MLQIAAMNGSLKDSQAKQDFAHEIGSWYFRGNSLDLNEFERGMSALGSTKEKQAFLAGVALGSFTLVSEDFEAFQFYRDNLPENGDFSSFVEIVPSIKNDHERILELVPMNDREIALELRRELFLGWGKGQPEAVVDYIAQSDASDWGKGQPEAVVDYIAQSDASDYQHLPAVIKNWVNVDTHHSVEWFESLPPGEVRDVALPSLISSLQHVRPAEAWRLALAESGQMDNVEMLNEIYAEWQKRSPGMADEAWAAYAESAQSTGR